MSNRKNNPFNLKPSHPTTGNWRVCATNWGWQILSDDWNGVLAAISGRTGDPRFDERARADALLMAASKEMAEGSSIALAALLQISNINWTPEQKLAIGKLRNALKSAEIDTTYPWPRQSSEEAS